MARFASPPPPGSALTLGDTETPEDADWSLRAQAVMVVGFFDALGIARAHVVGHDHGGAVAQLLAAEHPRRIDRLVLSNVEAYDNWPSAEERPFVKLTHIPLLGDAVMWLYARRPIFRLALIKAKAVKDPASLTVELVEGYVRANLSDRHRRAKTRRFLAAQFDPQNNRTTLDLLDGLRRFDHPTLLLRGADDVHFGLEWGAPSPRHPRSRASRISYGRWTSLRRARGTRIPSPGTGEARGS